MYPRERPSIIDRFLRLFTDIRSGESVTVLLLASNIFLFLLAYYLARVLREPLILTGGGDSVSGAQLKAYTAAGQVVLLAVIVPLYGTLADRVPRRRLINTVTALFVLALGGFFLLAQTGLNVGIPFYIFVGILSVMIVAQFWAFANDVYTEEEGKRLFPIVGLGAAAGASAGALIAGQAIDPLGLNALFLLAAVVLILATAITNVIDIRERRRSEAAVPDTMTSGVLPAATGQFRAATGEFKAIAESEAYQRETGSFPTIKPGQSPEDVEREQVKSTGGAFALVFRSRYLLLIGMLVMVLNWVNTNGGFMLDDFVERTAETAVANAEGDLTALKREFIGSFYARFLSVVTIATLLIQAFVVSRIIKYFGVKGAILFLPIIALGAYTLLVFIPILSVVRWAKTAENSTDYSLNNTVRNVLFLPTTREEKYKGKQVTDAFFQRAGDVLSAATVFIATGLLAFKALDIVYLNIVLVAIWLVIAVLLGRRYGRLVAVTES